MKKQTEIANSVSGIGDTAHLCRRPLFTVLPLAAFAPRAEAATGSGGVVRNPLRAIAMRKILITLLLLLAAGNTMATTYYKRNSSGGTKWSASSSWTTVNDVTSAVNGGTYPQAGDTAYLKSGSSDCTIDTPSACAAVDCTGYTGTLTFDFGITITGDLTLGGTAQINQNQGVGGNLTIAAGTAVNIAPGITVSNNATFSANGTKGSPIVLRGYGNANQVPDPASGTPSGGSSSALKAGSVAEAFDHLIGSWGWYGYGGTSNSWLQYKFTNSIAINTYTVYAGDTTSGRKPKRWILYGSGTGAFGGEEVALDDRSSVDQLDSTGNKSCVTYNFVNSTAYQYYRLSISANWGDTWGTGVTELFLGIANPTGQPAYLKVASTGTVTSVTVSDIYVVPTCWANPTMTASNAPAGEASASNWAIEPYKAFDHSKSEGWLLTTSTYPQWLQYKFASPTAIQRYTISSRGNDFPGNPTRKVRNWTFLASNTGAFAGEQVTLDTQTDQFDVTLNLAETKSYWTANTNTYTYYRLNISTNWGGGIVDVGELELDSSTNIITTTGGSITRTLNWAVYNTTSKGCVLMLR